MCVVCFARLHLVFYVKHSVGNLDGLRAGERAGFLVRPHIVAVANGKFLSVGYRVTGRSILLSSVTSIPFRVSMHFDARVHSAHMTLHVNSVGCASSVLAAKRINGDSRE